MLPVDLEILLSCLRNCLLTRWLAETQSRYCTCKRAHLLWYSAVLVPLTITFCSVPPLTFMFTNMYLNFPSGSMSTSGTLLRASAIFAGAAAVKSQTNLIQSSRSPVCDINRRSKPEIRNENNTKKKCT